MPTAIDAPPADVLAPDCPARAALELVAGKWALSIVTALDAGALRNNELLRRVGGGVSQKVLTQALRELERNGLVTRAERAGAARQVRYALTPTGRSLSAALTVVDRWVMAHGAELAQARAAFDARLR